MNRSPYRCRLFALFLCCLCSPFPVQATSSFFVADTREISFENAPALSIRFTAPLSDKTDLASYLSVSPRPEGGTHWIPQSDNRQWILPFVQSNTEYRITQQRLLNSASGQQQAYRLDATAQPISSWKIHTAPRPAQARFDSQGLFFAGDLGNGLPVTLLNQPEVDLDLFRVRTDQIPAFLARQARQGETRSYQLRQLEQYAELVHTARYSSPSRTDQQQTYNFSLEDILDDPAERGLYVAILRKPGRYQEPMDMTYFSVTGIGLHVRQYRSSLSIQTHRIDTAAPMPQTRLTLFWTGSRDVPEHQEQLLADDHGEASWQGTEFPEVILAQAGGEISFVRLRAGNALDLADYHNVTARHQSMQGVFLAPRDLYRPGETVTASLLLKDHDGRALPSQLPLQATLYDGRGRKQTEFVMQPTASGVYPFRHALPDSAASGRWRLTVGLTRSEVLEEFHFRVESFVPERLQLAFGKTQDDNRMEFAGQPFRLPVSASYLYGAPAAGLKLDARLMAVPEVHPFRQWQQFHFGDAAQTASPASLRTDAIRLDEQGNGALLIKPAWQAATMPLRIRASTSVYEADGRPLTRQWDGITLPEHPPLPGIRPGFDGNPAFNSEVPFQLISVDRQGNPVSDSLKVQLVHLHRRYFYEYTDAAGWQSRSQRDPEVVGAWSVEIAGQQPLEVRYPVEWGEYQLEVTSRSGITSIYRFQTQWNGNQPEGSGQKPQFISIELDRAHYAPGDTMITRINAPVSGPAQMTFASNDGPLLSRTIDLQQGENQLQFTVPNHWDRHDIYLTIMQLNPGSQQENNLPRRALGISPLPLLRNNAVAQLALEVPERTGSNQGISATVRVINQQQLGEQPLYATFSLTDRGIHNITEYGMPRPEQQFFSQRRFENHYFDNYNRFIDNTGYSRLEQRFGGDAARRITRGGEVPAADVRIVSFFSEPVLLSNGTASAAFELPVFNGTLEWQVWVHGEESFGSIRGETRVADKIMARLGKPRFLARGDRSQLSLDLHNLSDAFQPLQLQLTADGPLANAGMLQSLQLAPHEQRHITIPVKADGTGRSNITLMLEDANGKIRQQQWFVKIREPYPARTRMLTAALAANDVWQTDVDTADLRTDSVNASLALSGQLPVSFSNHFRELTRYPYGCIEQLVSQTYPWLLLTEPLLAQRDLASRIEAQTGQSYSATLRMEQINQGLQQVYARQSGNGGFGYWQADGPESFWGSVYATELLVEADRQQIAVNPVVRERAIKRLTAYLQGQAADQSAWSSDSIAHQLGYRAYAAYVLARANAARLSDVRRLFSIFLNEQEHMVSPLPLMQLAAAFELLGDAQNARQANQLALEQHRGDGYYRDYGSPLRDAALSYAIALQEKLDGSGLAERVIAKYRDKTRLSTQERIALARVSAILAGSGEPWKAAIHWQQGKQVVGSATTYTRTMDGQSLAVLEKIEAVGQPLFLRLEYQGSPESRPAPESHGLAIERHYLDLQGNPVDPGKLTGGDLLLVMLEVSLKERLSRIADALVVDLLPAGLQLENQNLQGTAVPIDSIPFEGATIGEYRQQRPPLHEDFRDDRYVAAIDVQAGAPTRLFYLARAVTPGKYRVPAPFVESMYQPELYAIGEGPDSMEITNH